MTFLSHVAARAGRASMGFSQGVVMTGLLAFAAQGVALGPAAPALADVVASGEKISI